MGIKWFLLKLFFLVHFHISVNGEYYSSIKALSTLMDMELEILDNMETFLRKNENKLNFLKEKLSDYERQREEASIEGPTYFENPVNKYLLTKRLTNDWEKIENLLQYKEGEEDLNKIVYTNIEDSEYEGGIDGLLRLQDTYRLNTSDIAQGILQGVQYDAYFESHHCFDIGQRALEANFFKLAYSWFNESLRRYSEKSVNSFRKLEKLDIELALANAKHKLGDIRGANQTYADLLTKHPDSEKIAKIYADFSEDSANKISIEKDYTVEHDSPIEDISSLSEDLLYKYTCANLLKQTPSAERELRCGYLTESHPFLILAPIKFEEMNHDPLLIIFHEVISDSEIEIVKNLSKSMERAAIMSEEKSIVSSYRTSHFVFIPPSTNPILPVIDQRVEDMTNLNMKFCEDHQVANYGIGGHYGQHHDFFDKIYMRPELVTDIHMGDRIATVLFYLSDVEQGGGTAFPYLKRLIMPKKGSAAFWYNLHASGEPDRRTLHAACPNIVGSKWVLNRWIREHDQSDRRPCELYDDSL